jgi:hypothetical protein
MLKHVIDEEFELTVDGDKLTLITTVNVKTNKEVI